jgi:hypothetical protein
LVVLTNEDASYPAQLKWQSLNIVGQLVTKMKSISNSHELEKDYLDLLLRMAIDFPTAQFTNNDTLEQLILLLYGFSEDCKDPHAEKNMYLLFSLLKFILTKEQEYPNLSLEAVTKLFSTLHLISQRPSRYQSKNS